MRTIIPVSLKGGLNLTENIHEVSDGECLQMLNYEVNTMGRYQRCTGYERYDGRPKPSGVRPVDLSGYPFLNDETEKDAVQAEIAARRAAIDLVPGSGKILGVFILKGIVYAFRNNGDGTEANLWKSSTSGWVAVTTPKLLPNGKYHSVTANFSGSAAATEIVGCDEVNTAFRFDGTTYTPLIGPVAPDEPYLVVVLPSQVLLMAYRGGSLVFSAVGEPTKFSAAEGGGEIAVSDEITALTMQANNSLMVGCRNRTYILYGTSKADFNLTTYTTTTGVHFGTDKSIGQTFFIDDRGITQLERVQAFGNFDSGVISQKIEPLISRLMNSVSSTFIVKSKNQYRICFDDNTGVIMTLVGGRDPQFSTFNYNHRVACSDSNEDDTGREFIVFGSDDGFVYEAESGTSFDGEPYIDLLRPVFFDAGAPEIRKRWHKAVVEAASVGETTITFLPDFDYSDPNTPEGLVKIVEVIGAGGYWDQGVWDEIKWTTASIYTTELYLEGSARNISLTMTTNSSTAGPHTINSIIYHATPRSLRR